MILPEEYSKKPLTAELLERFLEFSFDALQKYLKADRKAFIKDPNYDKKKDIVYIKHINATAVLLRRQIELDSRIDLEKYKEQLELLINKTRDAINIRKD